MSKSPPVFRQIAPLDVPDEALDALGDHLGVPKMLKPQSVPSSKVVSDPENAVRNVPPLPQKPTLPFALAETLTEKITVELPVYLASAIRRQGAERRITVRTLVIMGLQAIGFDVKEHDLVPDGRRVRSRNKNSL